MTCLLMFCAALDDPHSCELAPRHTGECLCCCPSCDAEGDADGPIGERLVGAARNPASS